MFHIKTLALEKFTGSEQEALRKLADDVTDLQAKYKEKKSKLAEMDKELQKTKAMTGQPILTPDGKCVSKNPDGAFNDDFLYLEGISVKEEMTKDFISVFYSHTGMVYRKKMIW